MTIGQKLSLGFGSLILLMIVSCIVVSLALVRIGKSSAFVTEDAIPALRACDDLLGAITRTTTSTRGLLILGDDSKYSSAMKEDLDASLIAFESAVSNLKAIFDDEDNLVGMTDYAPVEAVANEFLQGQKDVRAATIREGVANINDNSAAIEIMESRGIPAGRKLRGEVELLKKQAVDQIEKAKADLLADQYSARFVLISSSVLAVIIATIVAWILTSMTVSAIRRLLTQVQFVAMGDLSQPALAIKNSDELGDLTAGFNEMVNSLRSLLSETTSATTEVAAATGEIATGAQQQLASLNQTSTSLNEITTTAEEFKATMQEFADRAKAVHEAADETSRRATEGYSLSKDSASRIDKVRENSVSAGESVLHLADQMQRIGEITASVNEIAEQTKLLALNASIEAARAGEEGRGFAVVAMQVRELANQSKEAAGRIEALITQTQRSMQSVVGKIEDGGRLSEDSTSKVRNVSVAFDEITKAIEQTRQAMAQINTGARQQELSITELVASIVEIDSASKESVAAAEQTQRSIVSIDSRLRSLNTLIRKFKL
ncbi:methyl-accepting chemotaxis protein [Planctomicrobium sp. SH668]|uniref:methyl-accepting chemotaxis protein n=1 Tax=Planctomicrobium sp. SH668 TaxID=3448126 RepID=UPI003F5C24D2